MVALIAAAGLSILQVVVFNGEAVGLENIHWLECAIFLAAFLVLRIRKKNPILVMLCCGVVELAVSLLITGRAG